MTPLPESKKIKLSYPFYLVLSKNLDCENWYSRSYAKINLKINMLKMSCKYALHTDQI